MDKFYADTVRLLLNIAPDVFVGDIFALKGGTAINLFVRQMPRLSVDLDLVYIPWQTPRLEALNAISNELKAISNRLTKRGLSVHMNRGGDTDDIKLIVRNDSSTVKVEVNPVFRGTVLPTERRTLVATTADMFSASLELPVLALDELYASKIVAALDRQHPRDLFDVLQLYEHQGISDGTIECVVVYLSGHHRPLHELLFAKIKNTIREYESTFVGLTLEPVEYATLQTTLNRLVDELRQRLSRSQRDFLVGLAKAQPDWNLLSCPHASDLPALRWKLLNLEKFKKSRPDDFAHHVNLLTKLLNG